MIISVSGKGIFGYLKAPTLYLFFSLYEAAAMFIQGRNVKEFGLVPLPPGRFPTDEWSNRKFLNTSRFIKGLPSWLSSKESTCQWRKHKRCGFNAWVRRIPWSRKWQPVPVFMPGKFHGQSGLVDYSPWSHKEQDTTERLSTRTHRRS